MRKKTEKINKAREKGKAGRGQETIHNTPTNQMELLQLLFKEK